MLPVVDPELRATVRMIVLYTVALIPASMLPGLLNMTGNAYVCAALLMGLVFLYFGVRLAISKSRADARKLFFCSIIYLPLLLAAMMMNPL